ncbi:MAG: efflux RND transporter periplasmic adaptor subunit [Steroidobacterales bacterium]
MNAPILDDAAAGRPAGASGRKKLGWTLAILALVALGVIGLRYRAHSVTAPGGRFGAGGPLAVGVAKVTTGEVPITVNALGTVTPLATVTVHPQITGPLVKVDFTEGKIVKAGEVLAEIDPRPFQATLDQALGQLKRDQALLANARIDLARYKTLLAQDSVSDQTYATQVSTVAQDEATVAFDEGAVESAKLNLSYCRIVSPVTGLVGLRQVDIGNLLQANTSTIVIVTQMQPMSVLFTVPEDSVSTILDHLHRGEKLTVQAFDRSLTNQIASGTLSNSDNQIDTTTGTLKLRAMFDNSKLELFPNQFVNVHLILETLRDQIVVPGAALQNGSHGSYVYLVNADNTVSMRPVVAGPTAGDLVAITQGVSSGQTVVVDGADQLRDGAKIMLPQAPAAGSSGAGAHLRRNGAGGGSADRGGDGAGATGGSSTGGGSNGGQHRRQHPNGGDGDAPAGGASSGGAASGGAPPPS